MRKALIAAFVLLLVVSVSAQVRTGNILGKVVDPEGNPLPGVSVSIESQYFARMSTVTSAEGMFRFLSLPSGKDYTLRLELTGFKTRVESGVIVAIGANANLNLVLEPGGLEEQVTVTAISPVVDAKKTAVGTNVSQDMLQGLPTARDPWVVLQMAPSIIVDRENVGGAESGQQSNYVGRGDASYNNNVWAMDGIVITDPSAIGASPSYYDFDAFEEMQITVGGADVTVQTGGIALNMVTRRAGNKVSLGGRFYYIDEKFQAQNTEEVAAIIAEEQSPGFFGINKIKNNKDYGFNLGLPLVKDKAWFWFSYGIQDIKTTTVYAQKDDTLLENYVGKLNLQIIPENRFEAFAHVGGKKKFGRSGSAVNPEGLYQQGRYHFGSPIYKLQDEHMIGNDIFLSFKFAYSDAGFSLTPMTDLNFVQVPIWDVTAQRYYGSQASRYYVERPVYQYNFLGSYFNDNFLGASHEFKLGIEYAKRNEYGESVWSGNLMVNRNYRSTDLIWDRTGDQIADPKIDNNVKYFSYWRGYYRDKFVDALALYVSDTISFGRFNVILGLRYDSQRPYLAPTTIFAMDGGGAWDAIADDTVQSTLDGLMPGLDIPARDVTQYDLTGNQLTLKPGKYSWKVFSPRIGLTYDITGDGKTIAKLNLAQYGDFMGVGSADAAAVGGTDAWMDFWWWDQDANSRIALSELYWLYRRTPGSNYSPYNVFDDGEFVGNWDDASGYYWGDFDPEDPGNFTEPYQSRLASVGSSRTSEIGLTLEREIFTDFSVSLVGTYRKYDKFNRGRKYWLNTDGSIRLIDGSATYYANRGFPEASYYRTDGTGTTVYIPDTKDSQDHEFYTATAAANAYSPYSIVEPLPNYYQDYYGFDIIANKRLSNKWMMNANFTWQKQARHYGEGSYFNATNVWAYDGRPQSANIGGASGKINQYTYTPWMFKIAGLYQLPWDIDVSGTFNMRDGWIQEEYYSITDNRIPSSDSRGATLQTIPFGSVSLPLFYNFSIRIEKMVKLGDTGRIYIMADIFNVLNKMIENRRYQRGLGSVSIYGQTGNPTQIDWSQTTYTPYVYNNALNEVLNPRVTRIGVRFQF